MSSSDVAIRVKNLSKCYQIYDAPRDRLKQFFMPRIRRMVGKANKQYFREFWALKDISFEIKKGETVGIIGRNGAGKSTLLQIVCSTLAPTHGSVEVNGRVAALLELGSGFNPEFTGHENIYMNAAILGLTQSEIDDCYDDILAFADIGDFIHQPAKTYSSGMLVRLAFAVYAQTNPDILIVDEALAVGDAKFQAKCFERLRQLKQNGTSILLVTHSSEQIVTHCSSAILLEGGQQIEAGEPKKVVNHYLDLLFGKEKLSNHTEAKSKISQSALIVNDLRFSLNNTKDVFSTRVGYNPHEYRWGDGQASILDYYLSADGVSYPSAVTSGQKITLAFSVLFQHELFQPIVGVILKTKEGVVVYGANTETLAINVLENAGQKNSVANIVAEFDCKLSSGDYFLSIGVASRNHEGVVPHDRRYDSIHLHVVPNNAFFGIADLNLTMNIHSVQEMS